MALSAFCPSAFQAIEAVRWLLADSQDEIARTILHLAGSEIEADPIDSVHLTAVLEGLAQAKRREFATDEEFEAAFRLADPILLYPRPERLA